MSGIARSSSAHANHEHHIENENQENNVKKQVRIRSTEESGSLNRERHAAYAILGPDEHDQGTHKHGNHSRDNQHPKGEHHHQHKRENHHRHDKENHHQHENKNRHRDDHHKHRGGGRKEHEHGGMKGHGGMRGHSDMGGHNDYASEMFKYIGIIKDNLGFDVEKHLDKIYAKFDGLNIKGGAGTQARENRDKYNAEIIEMMSKLNNEIDKQIGRKSSNELTDKDMATLNAVSGWIRLGLHAGHDNGRGTHTHSMEHSYSGIQGAAFVIAHGMQAGKDTLMDKYFRGGGEVKGALGELNGVRLFNLMKSNGGLTGLYEGEDGKISTFYGASAARSHKQNPSHAIDYFRNN